MMTARFITRGASIALVIASCACSKGSSPSAPTQPIPTPPSVTVTGLTVTGPGCSNPTQTAEAEAKEVSTGGVPAHEGVQAICSSSTVGATIQLTATAQFSDSTSQSVTSQSQWSSSNTNVATVSNAGLVTVVASGETDVVAIYQGWAAGQTIRATIPSAPTAPVVAAHPSNQVATIGATVTFSTAATGSPTPTVQWQSRVGSAAFADILGANQTYHTFAATAADDGREFRAVFTNSAGSATTNAAVLTVTGQQTAPVITTHPSSQKVAAGDRVTFTAAATGSPTPTVQWQASSNGGASFLNIDADAPSYTFTARPNDDGWQFRAVFTNSAGSATTSAAILTVTGEFTAPIVTANPASQTVAAGTVVTFSAAAIGAPAPAVRWETRPITTWWWSVIAGATATSYTHVASQADDGRQFRAVFRNLQGEAYTKEATLNITCAPPVPPTVTAHPRSRLVAPEQYVSFSATASGCPVPTVQWQKSMDGGTTWTNEPGATAWEWELGARYNDLLVRAVFTNVAGTAVTNTATLTILHPPEILVQPQDLTVAAGATVTFTASARCVVAMTRDWSITGGSITDTVDGTTLTTTQSFTATASDNGRRYSVMFCPIQCWDLCCTRTRDATLTIASPPEITTHPASRTVAPGTTVTFTAAATGNPVPTAQWQVSANGGASFADIAGATSTSYSFSVTAADNGKQFRARFSNSANTAYSNPASLTVQ